MSEDKKHGMTEVTPHLENQESDAHVQKPSDQVIHIGIQRQIQNHKGQGKNESCAERWPERCLQEVVGTAAHRNPATQRNNSQDAAKPHEEAVMSTQR